MSLPREEFIRASEIGEYIYCARSWWLRRVGGYEPGNERQRKRGTIAHRRFGRSVRLSRGLIVLAAICALLALLIGVMLH